MLEHAYAIVFCLNQSEELELRRALQILLAYFQPSLALAYPTICPSFDKLG